MNLDTCERPTEISIAAVVTRADGSVEDHGIVAYWHRNPLRRALWRIRHGRAYARANPELGATVIVNGGHAIVTNRIMGAGTEPKQIGWGTGVGTAAVADTTLFTEKDVDLSSGTGTRTTGASSQVTTTNTNDTYQVTGTRTATGAGTVTNAGLWDNAAIASGTLYLKGDFVGIGLASADSIAFTFKVKFS